jgi:ubiquitin C-terminal hydrolase
MQVLTIVPDEVRLFFIEKALNALQNLTDEQLKKENCDSITSLLRIIAMLLLCQNGVKYKANEVKGIKRLDPFYQRWFGFVLRLMGSGSLVLKLLAWDVAHDLVSYATEIRPVPKAYSVEGSSLDFVNGIYNFNKLDKGSPLYDRTPTRAGEPLVQLLRFNMKDKSVRWFLSTIKPGNGDIDYFEDMTTSLERKLPSQNDWLGVSNYQKSAPPTVRRLGFIMLEGVTEEMLLVSRLSKWAVDQDILSHVFGQNMHREIIARSDRLLVFLAENKAIREDHIQMIWKAAMASTTEDIVDEIWNILVGLSAYIDASLYQIIVDLALAQIKDEAGYAKVASFLENYNREQYKYLLLLQRSDIAPHLLHLLWEIYRSPFFSSLKNSSNILDLLSRCLQFKCGNAFVLQRIQESSVALMALNQNRNLNYPTDEVKASQIVLSLSFLMSRQMDETIVVSLYEENFPKALIDEIDRFVAANYPRRISNEIPPEQYANGIAIRLNVLRRYFGLSVGVKINISHIEVLWNLLSSRSDELNEFLTFLKNGGEHQDDIRVMIDTDVALEVFQRFICSSMIDWKLCDDNAFVCFVVYFNKLKDAGNQFSRQVSNQIQSLGLQSLWRIAMTIPSETATRSALEAILSSYTELSMEYHDAYTNMLNIIFDHLNDCMRHHGENQHLDAADIIRIERCVGILYEAILRSKQDTEPSHIVRGLRSRMVIKVFYKKMNAYYNYNTQAETLTPMKGSEGSIDVEVHPMHTVAVLKKKIMEQSGFTDPTSVVISFAKHPLENSQRLYHVGITDGCEVSVIYKIALSKYSATPLYQREDFTSQGNVGTILSNDPQKFDVLLSLCSLILSQYHISTKVWAILMLIPTKFEVWHQLFSFYVNDLDNPIEYEDVNWQALAKDGPLPKLAYCMQIVDQILLPAMDCESSLTFEQMAKFRQNFISRNGFKDIVEVLLAVPSHENFLQKDILGTALHITHFCLFYSNQEPTNIPPPLFVFGDLSNVDEPSNNPPVPAADTTVVVSTPNQALLHELLASSTVIVEKLLKVAGEASTSQDSGVVQDSLAMITALLQSSTEVASTVINNPQAKVLLATVLRGASRKVRALAADFAIQFGTTQSIVFKWLLSVLDNLESSDDKCDDIFRASLELMIQSEGRSADDYAELAELLSRKLISFSEQQQLVNEPHHVLHGYLELLAALINNDIDAVMKTKLGGNLLPMFLEKFLFAIPDGSIQAPICSTTNTKQAAFKVLLSLVSVNKSSVSVIIEHINNLCQQSAPYMMFNWEMMLSQDVKRSDINFLGLKNQGCTCYSNSFLQQLFMNVSFRNAIMMTPLLEHHRTTLWHKTNEELVGLKLLFEFRSGSWHPGNIISYDPITKRHVVEYIDPRNNAQEPIRGEFNIREGRKDCETGRIRMPPPEGTEPIAERDDAANRVLEQLQRAFCFLEYSKKRFYDPRPLVEACKVLNLNFDVYHQNDAAEFCDQLLDRIETATKGKYTQKDIWSDVLKKRVFGGNFLTQKIPQECDTYQSDKKNCGHWQSSKQESFLKVELIIRGKETIDESLKELVQGELMDGENKINCDVCGQKKATTRRTCIESLPQTLIVHLKRFDLDFTTFETVKLNSKLEFPVKLNVLKYTKDGMESEERKQQVRPPGSLDDSSAADSHDGSIPSPHGNVRPSPSYGDGSSIPGASSSSMPSVQSTPTIEYEESYVEPDPADFDYELQGVLVHSGVAQGGHYYSFIKDPNEGEKWYRFDDDDVSPFSADQIPYHCFGGPSGQSNSSYDENERTSNALMLFYTKVKSTVVFSPTKDEIMTNVMTHQHMSSSTENGAVLVDGYQAFAREVHESNLQHVLSCYLLDSDLHCFVRDVLSNVSKLTSPSSAAVNSLSIADPVLAQQTFQFSLKFLLDTILHCRERSGTKSWLQVFQQHFEAYPSSALWFLKELVGTNRSWLREYLLISSDFMSRSTFVHIIMHAVTVLSPFDESLVNSYHNNGFEATEYGYSKLQLIVSSDLSPPTEAYIAQLIHLISKYVFEVPQHMRNADELFVLIRDLASIPCICKLLNFQDMISKLCFFVIPDSVYQSYKDHFVVPVTKNRSRPDYFLLFGPIFEAIASLLGVPQVRKIALLQDNRTYWERQLVPEAKGALIAIFQEASVNGIMDYMQLSNFLEKIFGHKPHQSTIKHMLDSSNISDGKLTLDGFLQYYTDKASYAAKEVWMVGFFLWCCV